VHAVGGGGRGALAASFRIARQRVSSNVSIYFRFPLSFALMRAARSIVLRSLSARQAPWLSPCAARHFLPFCSLVVAFQLTQTALFNILFLKLRFFNTPKATSNPSRFRNPKPSPRVLRC